MEDFEDVISIDNGAFLSKETEINLEFNDLGYVESLRQLLLSNHQVPLEKIIMDLQQMEYFPDKAFLDNAKLVFDEELQEEWRGNWISTYLSFLIPVPGNDLSIIKSTL